MHIPRPAKLLFQIDDGWDQLLIKNGHAVPEWTKLVIEGMSAYGTRAMGIHRYCCASPAYSHTKYFCQSYKSKGCSASGMKVTKQWISEQQHILPDFGWQHITFTMPNKLWTIFANNWPLLNKLFSYTANTLLKWAKKLGIEIGLFVVLHTYGCQLNSHPPIHDSRRTLPQTRHLASSYHYISHYLKIPPIAASKLRHYTGGAVVHHYFDHRTRRHRIQRLTQEEMLYVISHPSILK